jgi:hypothetical protein
MSTLNVDIVNPQSGTSITVSGNLIVTGTNNIRPYKVWSALLNQSGTSAPTVMLELENTLGPITFNYIMPGMYQILSNGLFINNKTIITGNNVNSANGETAAFDIGGPNFCRILTRNGPIAANDCLSGTFVEIRVYN